MTDEQVKAGFDEVYNGFWRKYKDNIPDRHSEEWNQIYAKMEELQKLYPFLDDTLRKIFIEFDERKRRNERP